MAGEKEGEGKDITQKQDGWKEGRKKTHEMKEPIVKLEEGREKGVER